MSFDRDLAREVLESRDRDTALFFAGREHEIKSFDGALREADKSRQAAFRIYQGAPGCGKTSLAAHLEESRSEETLFVTLHSNGLNDADALSEQVRTAAIERGSGLVRTGAALADFVGAYMQSRPIGDATRDLVSRFAARRKRLVLHVDEAHAQVTRASDLLLRLHTRGVGVPCVMLLTGLGHTADRVANIEGLSRLASNAVVEMGTMAPEECAQSTRKMLVALKVSLKTSRAEALSRLTGELAMGWPQHLHCAQTALCGEFVRTGGMARDVKEDRVRSACQIMRYRYYQERVRRSPVLGFNEELTKRIIVDIAKAQFQRHDRAHLEELCESLIEKAGLSGKPLFGNHPGEAFCAALIEKGVLSSAHGIWETAIPSMAEWAEAMAEAFQS